MRQADRRNALGVSMDDIFIDYELTNTAASVEDRLPEAAAYFNDMLSKNLRMSASRTQLIFFL